MFIDSYRFLKSSLVTFSILLPEKSFQRTPTDCGNSYIFSTKNLAFLYEHFHQIEDQNTPINEHETQRCFSRLSGKSSPQNEIDQTNTKNVNINPKRSRDQTWVYYKLDVTLLVDTFQTFNKTCYTDAKIIDLYFVSLTGCTWEAGVKAQKQT